MFNITSVSNGKCVFFGGVWSKVFFVLVVQIVWLPGAPPKIGIEQVHLLASPSSPSELTGQESQHLEITGPSASGKVPSTDASFAWGPPQRIKWNRINIFIQRKNERFHQSVKGKFCPTETVANHSQWFLSKNQRQRHPVAAAKVLWVQMIQVN